MHHAGLVNCGKPVRQGIDQRHDSLGILDLGARPALESRRQGASIGIIHHEIGPPIVEPAEIVDRHDVGRADPPQQPRFLQEPEPDLFVVRKLLVQDFERDQGFQFLVPGLYDQSETALGYLITNFVATDIGW